MHTPVISSRPRLRVAVTGGTSGLGLALVEAFAARGDAVAFVARHGAAVAAVARRIEGCHGIVGDVARKEDAHAIALQVGAALGGLDVLINNASSLGPVPLALLADTECEDFEAALATNLAGPFRLTKALLGLLAGAAREGVAAGVRSVVLNVSSDAAVTPYAGWGAYGASKAALAHLSRIWDEELRPHGVAVVAVDPGDMDTPLHALAVPDADPATLQRPRDAARALIARIDRAQRRARTERVMKAATVPIQRPRDARLLVVDAAGSVTARPRAELPALLAAGDLVIANDAATLPASLAGRHLPSGAAIELRLAGRDSLDLAGEAPRFRAVAFGAGDFRTRTEDRPLPPPLAPGDRLALGPLEAEVLRTLGHPRLVEIRFAGDADAVNAGIARHGRPVQYAHLAEPLALWDVWTRIAGPPVAFEPPSAGFVLDWRLLDALRRRGVGFATLTHAAGLSSTGDPALDARLPFDEPYRLPAATVAAIEAARARGGRVVAIGTTVARALEHAAARAGGLLAGSGIATNRLGAASRLRVVDVLVSGTHEPGSSHHALLRAFVAEPTLARIDAALEASDWRTHEFGDSVWIERAPPQPRWNLNTATLAKRFGQVRTTLPA